MYAQARDLPGHPRRCGTVSISCAVRQARRASGEGADLAPSRRRDQCDCRRAARESERSGAQWRTSGEFHRKGGVSAFREMSTHSSTASTMALTADVPKVWRVVGLGIVKLASLSGRPIYPVAVATRRRITLNTWDRTVVNLPFGAAADGRGRADVRGRGGRWGRPRSCPAALLRSRSTARLSAPTPSWIAAANGAVPDGAPTRRCAATGCSQPRSVRSRRRCCRIA